VKHTHTDALHSTQKEIMMLVCVQSGYFIL
jgi:hypothetical protein